MTTRKKQTIFMTALCLFALLAVFAVSETQVAQGRVLYQFIPGALFGAVAVFLLYIGGMLRDSLTLGAPFYGLVGIAAAVLWEGTANNRTGAFFRFDALGFSALFAQSEFNTNTENVGYVPTFAYASSVLLGAVLVLFGLALIRAVREKKILSLFRFGISSAVWLVLPCAVGFLENLSLRQYNWYHFNTFRGVTMEERMLLFYLAPAVYLLIGNALGLLAAKAVAVPRVFCVLWPIAVFALWAYVVSSGYFADAASWISRVGFISRETSGVFLGFTAGIALRGLFAKRT